MKLLIIWITLILVLMLADFIWLGIISRSFIKDSIGHLMSDSFKIVPALLFYLMYATALIFLVFKDVETGNYSKVVLSAVFIGLTAYGTYELVNFSTLKDWPLKMVIVDTLWGIFVTVLSSSVVYWVMGILER